MPLMGQVFYRFGPFLLDPAERLISRDGVPLTLTPKVFDTLLCLVRNYGHVLTKDELLSQVWPDTFVEEVNLAVNISTLRKAFGESPHHCRYIATVPGRGYKFVAEVEQVSSEHDGSEESTSVASQPRPAVTRLQKFMGTSQSGSDNTDSATGEDSAVGRTATGRALKAVIQFAIGLLALAAVTWLAWFGQAGEHASAAKPPSIVVLPFVDLSSDRSYEYFADGLTEELIGNLAKVPGLKVVAKSSAFQFKGRNEDLRSVGQKLGASNVLEGSVSVQGDRVRIRAELIKAEDGFQIWSETYDRNIDDIFAVQDEIATAAISALEVKLLGTNGATDSAGPRTNALAYQAYLQAQDFFGSDSDKSSLTKALAYSDQAIKLDANYGPAWALRSRILSQMAAYAMTEAPEGYRQAREAAERSVALNPNVAQGYLALGWIQMDYDWDWKGAEVSLMKAAELEPGCVEVLRYRSWLYLTLGRLDEALELYKKVAILDPLHARSYSQLGYLHYFLGQYQEAEVALRKASELNPQKELDHVIRGQILLAERHPDAALAEIEGESSPVWKTFGEALAYHDLGRNDDSNTALDKLTASSSKDAAYQIATVHAYRGESDKAFEWLDLAYRRHDAGLTCIKFDPLLNSLRRDPRYAELLRKMRLPS